MKHQIIKAFLITASLVISSHAILGLGVHWAPNIAATIDDSQGDLLGTTGTTPAISLKQEGGSGLQGAGVKFWIDVIPFIDVEASLNLQFLRYSAALELTGAGAADTIIPLEVATDLPLLDKASPVFGKVYGDFSVLYPFFKFPPMVKLIKIYAGAGITYMMSTAILDQQIASEAISDAGITDPTNVDAISTAVIDKFIDKGLTSGIGGHLIVGAKVKPPIIPIAVYVNGKYHLGGGLADAVSSGLTIEMGAALAF